MKPTTWRLLLSVVVVSAALGWAVFRVWQAARSELPNVPWSAPLVIGLFAVAVFFTALRLRPRLQRRPGHKPLHPLVAARYAALALATSRTGAVIVGVYGGYLALVLTNLETDYRRRAALAAGTCILAGAALVGAGLLLERECKLPPEPPEEGKAAGGAGG